MTVMLSGKGMYFLREGKVVELHFIWERIWNVSSSAWVWIKSKLRADGWGLNVRLTGWHCCGCLLQDTWSVVGIQWGLLERGGSRLMVSGAGSPEGHQSLWYMLKRQTLAFTAKSSPQECPTLETREKVWRMEDLDLIEENWDRDHLGKLDTMQSMGPSGSWLMLLLGHSPSTLKGYAEQERCMRTRRKITSLQTTKRARRRTKEQQASHLHLHPWKDDGTDQSGCHL